MLLISDNRSTINHGCIGTVRAAKSVLLRPELCVRLAEDVEARGNPVPIFRMNAFKPPGLIVADLVFRIPEQRLHAIIPPNQIRPHVPVPNRIISRAGDQLKPFFALVHCQNGMLSLLFGFSFLQRFRD